MKQMDLFLAILVVLFQVAVGTLRAERVPSGTVDGVAAFVNEQAITVQDVMRGVPAQAERARRELQAGETMESLDLPMLYRRSLEAEIERCLILQAYDAGEQKIPERAFTQHVDEIIDTRYGGSLEKLQLELEASQMTLAMWRKMMEESIILRSMRQSYVTANVHLSPKAISSYYQANAASYRKPARLKVSVLALEDDETFAMRYASFTNRVAKGEALGEVIKALSVDVMAPEGGDYGWIEPEAYLAKRLAEAVLALKDGERTEPIQLGARRYVLFRHATKPERHLSLREVQEEIEAKLHETEANRLYQQWIERLKAGAAIQRFEMFE